jgi:hypothetical protein
MVEILEDRCLLDGGWARLAPMPTAREQPGAGVVDGLLYIVGGYNGRASKVWLSFAPVRVL